MQFNTMVCKGSMNLRVGAKKGSTAAQGKRQARDYCVAKYATLRAAHPDPSLRKKRLFSMTSTERKKAGSRWRGSRPLMPGPFLGEGSGQNRDYSITTPGKLRKSVLKISFFRTSGGLEA
jgi:hypothetical protein